MSAAEPTITEPVAEPAATEAVSTGIAEQTTTVPISTPAAPANWRDALSPDLRGNPTLESLDSVEALAKEHINVQRLIGADKIERPKEDWTPEQFGDFYTKLGRPAEASDYDLDGVERPEDLPWDNAFQESMVGVMHEAGLSTDQVKKILGGYIGITGGQHQEAVGEMNRSRESGIQDLRNEWGKSYDGQVDLAVRAFRAGAGEGYEDVANLQLAGGGKLGDHPMIIKAFAALGGKMNEHGLVGGTTPNMTMSPEQAGGERNKLMADQDFLKAYLDSTHIEHAAAVKRINDLTIAEVGTE